MTLLCCLNQWLILYQNIPCYKQKLRANLKLHSFGHLKIFSFDRNFLSYNSNLFYSAKRGIDFGLGRGFSGSQAAKHFMGMAAASFSGGPGRKRKRTDPFQYPTYWFWRTDLRTRISQLLTDILTDTSQVSISSTFHECLFSYKNALRSLSLF